MEVYRAKLQTMLDATRQAAKEQTAMEAAKQDATQRLNNLLVEESEKLFELDLAPAGRRVKNPETGKSPTPPPTSSPTTA